MPQLQRCRFNCSGILIERTCNLKILINSANYAVRLGQITINLCCFKCRSATINCHVASNRVSYRNRTAGLLDICANRGSLNTAAFDGQGLNIVYVLGNNGFCNIHSSSDF